MREFVCIDLTNYSVKWRFPGITERVQQDPTVSFNGNVVFSSLADILYCVAPDGNLVWQETVPEGITTSCAVAPSGNIYLGTSNGGLKSFDMNGSLRWTYSSGANIQTAPAIDVAENIYFGNNAGTIYCVDVAGSLVWSASGTGQVLGSPALGDDGTLYVGAGNQLLAFGPTTPTVTPTQTSTSTITPTPSKTPTPTSTPTQNPYSHTNKHTNQHPPPWATSNGQLLCKVEFFRIDSGSIRRSDRQRSCKPGATQRSRDPHRCSIPKKWMGCRGTRFAR